MDTTIEKGAIVQVINEDNRYCRKQGYVVRTDDIDNEQGPIRVWFGCEYEYLYDYELRKLARAHGAGKQPPANDDKNNPRISNFHLVELVKEPEWTVKTLAERHWYRFYHSLYEPKFPFVAGGLCAVNDCKEKAVRRIVINIWGTVCPADTCEECAQKYHLKAIEDFPWRQETKEVPKKEPAIAA
jgi:hypothetical protein